MSNLASLLFLYIIVVLSSIIHEYAHGWAALRQGDPTAKYAGRLTLNPIPHIDIFGTVLLPLFLLLSPLHAFFGYAKPVPINPYNFKNQRAGMIWVSVAGVGANFFIAIVFGLCIRFYPAFFLNQSFFIDTSTNVWITIVIINIWLGLFNLLPFPPLDGSKLLLAAVNFRGGSGGFARFIDQLTKTPFGILIAIFVAMAFLPYLSSIIFMLIVGS